MALYDRIDTWDLLQPAGTEQLSQADDHMRGIKHAVDGSFPNLGGAVTASDVELNVLDGYPTGVDVDARFTAIETILGSVTAAEMAQLVGISNSATIEYRLDYMETVLGDATIDGLNGLDGYVIANGTIEARLQDHTNALTAIIAGENTTFVNLSTLSAGIQVNADRIATRTAECSDTALGSLSSYYGISLPADYSGADLGTDFQTLANKVDTLETGGALGSTYITWQNYLSKLVGGTGGINVTNTWKTKERFGFHAHGLEPGSLLVFRFYENVAACYGDYSDQVNNGTKTIKVSDTGQAVVSLSLGGLVDLFGCSGGRLPIEPETGRLHVYGVPKGTGDRIQLGQVNVQFFFDDTV